MQVVEYYLSLNSPWTYLGHGAFVNVVEDHNLDVAIFPVDYSVIFPETGGLPVGERAIVRQRYRIAELRRWREFHNLPLVVRPAHWPADETLAACAVMNCRDQPAVCLQLIGNIQTAMWAKDLDITDEGVLIACADEAGLEGRQFLEQTRSEISRLAQIRQSESRTAITNDVFGAPTYRYKNEIFWGQDRINFLRAAIESDQLES